MMPPSMWTAVLCLLSFNLRPITAQSVSPTHTPQCGLIGLHNASLTTFYMGNFFYHAPTIFTLCGDFCRSDTRTPGCKSFRYSYDPEGDAQYCEFFSNYTETYFILDAEQPYFYYDIDCDLPHWAVAETQTSTITSTIASTTVSVTSTQTTSVISTQAARAPVTVTARTISTVTRLVRVASTTTVTSAKPVTIAAISLRTLTVTRSASPMAALQASEVRTEKISVTKTLTAAGKQGPTVTKLVTKTLTVTVGASTRVVTKA